MDPTAGNATLVGAASSTMRSCEFDCTDAIAKRDGAKYLARVKEWESWGLNRSLELFFDDGEYLGWYNNLAHALDEDPVLTADYDKLQIPRMPWGQRDWMTYTSRWRAKNTETFKAAILQDNSSDITYNATYGEYTVGGDTLFRSHINDSWIWMGNGKWAEMRTINSPGRTSMNGDNHYGMSDYYPWNPDGRGCAVGGTLNVPPQASRRCGFGRCRPHGMVSTSFNGTTRGVCSRDRFFSPFIACGWSEKEASFTLHCCKSPAAMSRVISCTHKQMLSGNEFTTEPDLAILKSLMAAGAEYFHVGKAPPCVPFCSHPIRPA